MAGRQQASQPVPLDQRVDQFKEQINWAESAAAGVGAYVAGLVLTMGVMTVFNLMDEMPGDESTLDTAVWIFYEGIGGAVDNEELFIAVPGMYSALDTNSFGAPIALHGLVPAIVLVIFGYILASRHISQGMARTPLEGVVAGTSLAIGFFVAMFLAVLVFPEQDADILQLLLMGLAYPLVFASVGAALKSGARIRDMWGAVGGIGAFFGGLILWYLIEDPLDPASVGDLSGAHEHLDFVVMFLNAHLEDFEEGTISLLPEWYIIVVTLLAGIAVAYKYETMDPLIGAGKGARIGLTYFIFVALFYVMWIGTTIREVNDAADNGWDDFQIQTVNAIIGVAPVTAFLAGVVFPVMFATIGGMIGAKLYESQNT